MKTRKVKQFQIIQNKLDEIDILIVIDDDLRNAYPPTDELFDKIKKAYLDIVRSGITINVKEVKDIPSQVNKPTPLVISNLSKEEREKIIDKSK